MIKRLWLSLAVFTCCCLAADDWPDFDRPGILFAPSVLPVGAWSIELGLPEVSFSNREQTRSQETELHTMLRYGLMPQWELQLEMAPYIRQRVRQGDARQTQSGYSDTRLGARYDASPALAPWFAADAVALQAGIQLGTGQREFTESSNAVDLGLVTSWDLWAEGHAADLMLQWQGSRSTSSWFLATTYGAPVATALTAFVETGIWFGDDSASVVGGGLVWRPSAGFQLDSFILKRLSGDIADTQWGLGISWMWL
ncbi:transporter [Alkalimonas sp.]|uniref:transporter n=1 Tax=Alkalimonas sp. TaxID=1872453 RepID=UPI00263B79F8|nr:transporter [Alkalimonas sp.]MCC5827576.1 hypothetical protein [Alkalimonas sp.]